MILVVLYGNNGEIVSLVLDFKFVCIFLKLLRGENMMFVLNVDGGESVFCMIV